MSARFNCDLPRFFSGDTDENKVRKPPHLLRHERIQPICGTQRYPPDPRTPREQVVGAENSVLGIFQIRLEPLLLHESKGLAEDLERGDVGRVAAHGILDVEHGTGGQEFVSHALCQAVNLTLELVYACRREFSGCGGPAHAVQVVRSCPEGGKAGAASQY